MEAESMASSMKKNMSSDPIYSPEACIFRTPSILRRHKKEAYNPNAFSIGPFHHGKCQLQEAEKIKYKYLHGLVDRRKDSTLLVKCINTVKEVEEAARNCYAGEIGMSAKDFIPMLVLDGCFILELFRKDADVVPKDNDDPIFTMSCMLQFLSHDLIMLENQIPWFVLEKLFDLTRGSSESKTLTVLALAFFDNIFSSDREAIDLKLFANEEIKHILDLLRTSLVLPLEKEEYQQQTSPNGWEPLPSASAMAESGIKFMKVTSRSILDVKFVGGIFEMPPLLIQETIEPAFRNLISYEQCYPNCAPRVTCYAILLDNLINSTADMDELSKSEILRNWLNPQDVTEFFKMLYQDAYVKEFYYQNLCSDVKKHRLKRWPKWRAFYVHNYFGKPWAIVSQVVAAILLVLTVMQTIYSAIDNKKK